MLQYKCQAFHLYPNDKLFPHELKLLNYDGLWQKTKKNSRMKFDALIE